MSDQTDEQLMAAYVQGDQVAFRELFARFGPQIMALVRRRGLSESDSHDVVQQTFLQLHRAKEDYRLGQTLRPWIYTIALNLLREQWRRSVRRKESPINANNPDHEPSVEASEFDANYHQQQKQKLLMDALATLPDNQRIVIELHWVQGLPFDEVAKTVGANLSAVKVRAHRGYARLREQLPSLEPEEDFGNFFKPGTYP